MAQAGDLVLLDLADAVLGASSLKMRRDSPRVSAMVPSKSKIRERNFIFCESARTPPRLRAKTCGGFT